MATSKLPFAERAAISMNPAYENRPIETSVGKSCHRFAGKPPILDFDRLNQRMGPPFMADCDRANRRLLVVNMALPE
jgi:hypothetical protein